MNEKIKIAEVEPEMQQDWAVAIGDVVKIGLKSSNPSKPGSEWIWTIVTSIEGDIIHAILDNKPTHPHAKFGDHVEFKRENIYSIWC